MQIYVINLDKDVHRLRLLAASLGKAGIPFERVPGVDGRAPGTRLESGFDPSLADVLNPGEIGCCLSHVACWRLIAASDDECGCVLEDDVRFGPGAREALEAAAISADDLGVHRLETNLLGINVDARPIAVNGTRILYRSQTMQGCAGAYVISRRTARALCDNISHIKGPIDLELMQGLARIIGYPVTQWVPAPFVQDARLGRASIFGRSSSIGYDRKTLRNSRSRSLLNRIKSLVRPYYYRLPLRRQHRGGRRIFVPVDQPLYEA